MFLHLLLSQVVAGPGLCGGSQGAGGDGAFDLRDKIFLEVSKLMVPPELVHLALILTDIHKGSLHFIVWINQMHIIKPTTISAK